MVLLRIKQCRHPGTDDARIAVTSPEDLTTKNQPALTVMTYKAHYLNAAFDKITLSID